MTTPPLEKVVDAIIPVSWYDIADPTVIEAEVDAVITTPTFDAVGPLPAELAETQPPLLIYTAVGTELEEELTDEAGRSLQLEPDPIAP